MVHVVYMRHKIQQRLRLKELQAAAAVTLPTADGGVRVVYNPLGAQATGKPAAMLKRTSKRTGGIGEVVTPILVAVPEPQPVPVASLAEVQLGDEIKFDVESPLQLKARSPVASRAARVHKVTVGHAPRPVDKE